MCYFYFILAAVDFIKANPVLPVDVAAFEKNCGIAVNITPDQIEDCVSKKLKDLMEKLWKQKLICRFVVQ